MRREADFPGEPTTIGELMRTPQTTPTRDEAADFLRRLRAANVRRDAEYRAKTQGEPLPLLFRTTEFAGEVGELLNVVKKIERERLGWAGKRADRQMLLEEFGGVVATLDLLAMMLDVDLATATADEFNAVSDRLSLTTKLASAPAPASGGVHAVREALLGYVLKPGQYEMASAFARGQNRVAVDMLGVLDEASLSPAATPVSEAGPDWMEAQQVRKRRGVEIMQEYAWGNLTPLGVANHLKRAGFNIDYAQKIANDLAKPASSPAGVDVVQTLIDKTEKLIEAAEYGPYTPKPSPWWHPNLADAHSKNPPEAEHG